MHTQHTPQLTTHPHVQPIYLSTPYPHIHTHPPPHPPTQTNQMYELRRQYNKLVGSRVILILTHVDAWATIVTKKSFETSSTNLAQTQSTCSLVVMTAYNVGDVVVKVTKSAALIIHDIKRHDLLGILQTR